MNFFEGILKRSGFLALLCIRIRNFCLSGAKLNEIDCRVLCIMRDGRGKGGMWGGVVTIAKNGGGGGVKIAGTGSVNDVDTRTGKVRLSFKLQYLLFIHYRLEEKNGPRAGRLLYIIAHETFKISTPLFCAILLYEPFRRMFSTDPVSGCS